MILARLYLKKSPLLEASEPVFLCWVRSLHRCTLKGRETEAQSWEEGSALLSTAEKVVRSIQVTIKAKSPCEQIFGCIFYMVMIWIYYLTADSMFSLSKAPTEDASTKSLQSRQQKLPKLPSLDCRIGVMVTEGCFSHQHISIVWLEGLDNIINNTSVFHTRISVCLLDLSWGLSGCSKQGSPSGRVISSVNPCVIVGSVQRCVWMGLQFKKAS